MRLRAETPGNVLRFQGASAVLFHTVRARLWHFSYGVGSQALLNFSVAFSTGLRPVLRVTVWALRAYSPLSIQYVLLLCEAW